MDWRKSKGVDEGQMYGGVGCARFIGVRSEGRSGPYPLQAWPIDSEERWRITFMVQRDIARKCCPRAQARGWLHGHHWKHASNKKQLSKGCCFRWYSTSWHNRYWVIGEYYAAMLVRLRCSACERRRMRLTKCDHIVLLFSNWGFNRHRYIFSHPLFHCGIWGCSFVKYVLGWMKAMRAKVSVD